MSHEKETLLFTGAQIRTALSILHLCRDSYVKNSRKTRGGKTCYQFNDSVIIPLQEVVNILGKQNFARLCILSLLPHFEGLYAVFLNEATELEEARFDVYQLIEFYHPLCAEQKTALRLFFSAIADGRICRAVSKAIQAGISA